jgi:nucleoside-diphosphate-sugar epimerase
MNLLVTGVDRLLGRVVVDHLTQDHTLRLCGQTKREDMDAPDHDYRQTDLTDSETVSSLVTDVDGR